MEITKDIIVLLIEYDHFSRIEILYYSDNKNGVNPHVYYSNNNDGSFSSAEMEKREFLYHTRIKVRKNSEFIFSIMDDKEPKNYHIHLGENSRNCYCIEKDANKDLNEICDIKEESNNYIEYKAEEEVTKEFEFEVEDDVSDDFEATTNELIEKQTEATTEEIIEEQMKNTANEALENQIENIANEMVDNEIENIANEVIDNQIKNIADEVADNENENIANEVIDNQTENITNEVADNKIENPTKETIENLTETKEKKEETINNIFIKNEHYLINEIEESDFQDDIDIYDIDIEEQNKNIIDIVEDEEKNIDEEYEENENIIFDNYDGEEEDIIDEEYEEDNNIIDIDYDNKEENDINEEYDDDEKNNICNETSLIILEENYLKPRKGLRFSYKMNKRIKIMLIKLYRLMPNFIKGDYRRRINL